MNSTPVTKRSAGAVVMAAGLSMSCLSVGTTARAQSGTEQGPFVPWTGEMGVTESIQEILARDARRPKWDGRVRESDEREDEKEFLRRNLPQNPNSPFVPQWPWNFNGSNPPTILPGGVTDNPQTVSTSLTTLTINNSGFVPPDSMGAVGPNNFCVMCNGHIRAYTKAGAQTWDVNDASFFASVTGGVQISDPNVRYDPTSQRWFFTDINVSSSNNRVVIGVSNNATLNSSSTFTFFYFQHNLVSPAGDNGLFLDYDSLGVDANALYIGGNMFNGNFQTSTWVVKKASILGAGPIQATAFRDLLNGSGHGPFGPRGVDNTDPTYPEGYFIGVDSNGFGTLYMRRITNPGGTPSISANIAITIPNTTTPISVPSQGASFPLAAIDDRLFQAHVHMNRATGAYSLWTAHNIEVNSSGVAQSGGGRNGSRWYQLGSLTATPTLLQSGTLFDSSATNPTSYWMPSVAMTGQGHMAIGSSSASAVTPAGCSAAGRLSTDPMGSTQSPTLIFAGVAGYNVQSGGTQRWGDYSATYVDPTDDQTIWTFQEICNAANSWAIRATKLLAPLPATPATAVPSIVNVGQTNVPIFITGTSSNGSGFYDTAAGFNRLQAAFSGNGITVNNITFTDPTHITVTISVDGLAAIGGRTLTITNPDGQQAVSGAGFLTVNNGGNICPTFSTNPSPVTLCSGTQAQFTVAASGFPNPTFQWRLNTIPLTDGGEVSGSTTTTLTINPAGPGDVGSYDCVATNACGSTPSTGATLSLIPDPIISGQPSNVSVLSGAPASFSISASGATGYQWRRNSVPLSDGGNISGSSTTMLQINPATIADVGSYDCLVSDSCVSIPSNAATLSITSCYANCDGSTTPPVLNVLDFFCFLNAFALGDTYANCDGSTTPPVLNVLDFTCFLNKFSAGCS